VECEQKENVSQLDPPLPWLCTIIRTTKGGVTLQDARKIARKHKAMRYIDVVL